ncbi:MAG: DUF6165 family protein [Bacteroidales bacterium]|jgi:hypothetical protein|nr:DUF6165 family protein [Bacteroidales bacterium]
MKIEVSNGEIIDKLTIVSIKLGRIHDSAKRENLQKEFEILKEASGSIMDSDDPLFKALYEVNCRLWDIEDRIREFERKKDFGEGFISVAREVYFNNDLRAEIKREINIRTSSGLTEEKSYGKY